MEEVRGKLAVDILADVVRHAAFLRETGRIDVSSDRNRGWVVVRDGRPVHAVCRRPDGSSAHGLEALAAMLAWTVGEYAFASEPVDPAYDVGGMPSDAFLEAEEDPRTLSGDAETVLKEARAYAGHRNGTTAEVRPRFAPLSSLMSGRHVADRSGDGGAGHPRLATGMSPRTDGGTWAGESVPHGDGSIPGPDASRPVPPSGTRPVPGDALAGADVFVHDEPFGPRTPLASDEGLRVRPTSVLTRREGGDPEVRVTVSRGALDLWRHLDGATTLGGWCEELGRERAVTQRRAEELVRGGLAVVEPEPVYGFAFVSGLTEALNDIMGPMGEIVVRDALAELRLDPGDIPLDRVDELASALASHLQRSDWQLKLRARVARLRAETMETRTEASP